ncbi:hypothetical protein ACFL30_02540 [Candidatus Latescibacterota bacterium]
MHLLNHPPLRIYKFSNNSFQSGIEEHHIDGVRVRIYSPEKTLANSFKYRNKTGMDVVLESLKLYKARKNSILLTAQVCQDLPRRKGDEALSGGEDFSERTQRNLPAFVRQRLFNRSRRDQRPFNELLQYYTMEWLLYRLSQSTCVRKFILKGGLLLRAWRSPKIHPTMDIDMLVITSNEESNIMA